MPSVRLVLTFILIFTFFSLISNLLTLNPVLAGSGLVSSIGGATFIQGAKQFWVSSPRPAFSGVTDPGGNIDITIGAEKNGVVADSSGNWSFTPAADLSGDNQVTVATATSSVTFTLTIGALPENIASASGSTLAPAGSLTPTLAILGFGVLLTTFGLWGLSRSFAKSQ
ncbi:hypothetical protein A2W45_02440 [Candidatus Curtissbacteria bacterium RIFCSPHIGHO2_12_41_11]|uniref:Bacterial Ig-like domain-containing protein n=3 Tax=Candidatus Curtissiibacteriota TaxID=1752717 RepID=A0A1F5HR19_9BACT|nr:MAG: hypothetical protein UU56_C0014G0006 [Candidatus Curtissbacteria bacterium GW2011_GWA2_41_24]OGD90466.1 MAG: hypothetical protein A2Z54_01900 [Candidatus Curtissbacteria bacterium RIFCSPHIGHO2_02_39_8]OGD99946.1 MAG: hypothetical protein A2W45_02440 [Candidatus Curtissbacteria bacterium RIFCSPHIGHO2_12_41_11]OGE06584.1 MAG: hypothetical protein A2W70_03930 [Candidatus Curtissbacteria bacterium RIFCSPLOWO2_02_41_11]